MFRCNRIYELGFFRRARVVIHDSVGQRLAVAVDEEDCSGGGVHTECFDLVGGKPAIRQLVVDFPQAGANARPPTRGVLLVPAFGQVINGSAIEMGRRGGGDLPVFIADDAAHTLRADINSEVVGQLLTLHCVSGTAESGEKNISWQGRGLKGLYKKTPEPFAAPACRGRRCGYFSSSPIKLRTRSISLSCGMCAPAPDRRAVGLRVTWASSRVQRGQRLLPGPEERNILSHTRQRLILRWLFLFIETGLISPSPHSNCRSRFD